MNTGWKQGTLLRLIAFTDPYCTWCWGSEPILRKIEEIYGDQIKIEFVMGGLVKNISTFHDSTNSIGGEKMMDQIAIHWNEASSKHGMPVAGDLWLKSSGFTSTYPANIAFKAAEISNPNLAQKYLRRLREAAAAEEIFIHKEDVQIELAKEIELNLEKFIQALESGAAEKAFCDDLKLMRSLGVTGFPTFFVESSQGQGTYLHGYQSFSRFEEVFNQLNQGSLIKKEIIPNNENFVEFILKHEKVATKEVSEVFAVPKDEMYEKLVYLEKRNRIRRKKAGNGEFWISPSLE